MHPIPTNVFRDLNSHLNEMHFIDGYVPKQELGMQISFLGLAPKSHLNWTSQQMLNKYYKYQTPYLVPDVQEVRSHSVT